MWGCGAGGRILPMTITPPAHITLELEVDGDRIEGYVVCRDGSKRPFAGWLGLASALEDVIVKTAAA